jgi:hypothetical protein
MPVIQKRTTLALVHSRASVDYAAIDPAERRAYERLTVSSLSWLKRVRLKYGPAVTLIDLSAGGAQIETTSRHIQPGRTVVVEIAGNAGEFAIASQVLRCQVSGIAPQTIYRGALEFKQPLHLPLADAARSASEDHANPAHEYAKLLVALRRATASSDALHAETGVTSVGAASLAAAQAIIESPSARRAGPPFSRELGRLFGAIASWIDRHEPAEAIVAELTERLRRVIPARMIRLMNAASMLTMTGPDAVAFDVPSSTGSGTKLVVEFPRNCRLAEWHLQLLKVTAHLVALTVEVEEARRAGPEIAVCEEPPSPGPTWHRLVIRYMDGRMLKGYGRDFVPANGHVHVWPVPDAPPATRITVLLSQLKAVFFVREFDGVAAAKEEDRTRRTSGRRISVTFLDGEVLDGTTLNYSADGVGFFVSPTDGATNHHRIFVASGAVRHIQFP